MPSSGELVSVRTYRLALAQKPHAQRLQEVLARRADTFVCHSDAGAKSCAACLCAA
ncbi:hypothetical protein KL86PLE_40701 [uncultured Pleomorphomonas sp.]|uniref:Uncharacterized protein n=1 Tax=uncultured Pleomorphomonas sp. TaxID=442121 RepID=A0A212LH60_9HYPH|nr:hypothetical protein KL86PLE_40701 [uncultured Pleomorphomonas sp.]